MKVVLEREDLVAMLRLINWKISLSNEVPGLIDTQLKALETVLGACLEHEYTLELKLWRDEEI